MEKLYLLNLSIIAYAIITYSNINLIKHLIDFVFRLHHDQQTAHALESAAAYSSYPTMAGKCTP